MIKNYNKNMKYLLISSEKNSRLGRTDLIFLREDSIDSKRIELLNDLIIQLRINSKLSEIQIKIFERI